MKQRSDEFLEKGGNELRAVEAEARTLVDSLYGPNTCDPTVMSARYGIVGDKGHGFHYSIGGFQVVEIGGWKLAAYSAVRTAVMFESVALGLCGADGMGKDKVAARAANGPAGCGAGFWPGSDGRGRKVTVVGDVTGEGNLLWPAVEGR
ncbi:hypothetical protein KSP40_PGU022245 [Platanthera guangdongensis]|uniref:Uncharacterized protein n=1 Tax=Platanthera guangdongensis TaxID=2320717 RepID=A0ABR2M8D0_9ASPA